MKFTFTFILFLCLSSVVDAQVTVVQYGDTTYQEPIYWSDTVLLGWEIKENLPKGEYWIVKRTKCGVDTLARAEFKEGGIKNGLWTNYDRAICPLEEYDKGRKYSSREKKDQIEYDSGYLVSYSYSFFESGEPRLTYFYEEDKTDKDDWDKEVWYYENGKEKEVMSRFGISTVWAAYYQNGFTRYIGSLYEPGTNFWGWTFFHDNGFFQAEGKYSGERPRLRRSYHEDQLLQVGKWLYWDKKGKLIAKAWFEKGELIRVRLKNRAEESFEKINQDFKNKRVIIRQ